MKTNMMQIVQPLSLIFSLFFVSISCLPAQVLTKTYVNEINVSDDARINVQGPRSFDMEGHGTMSFTNEGNNYVVKGKNWEPIIVIDGEFQINTWEEKKVKQSIEIKLETSDPSEGPELLAKLNPLLKENAAGRVDVSCNLNIQKFLLANGFFRRDRSTLYMKDGSNYEIKKLEIAATLYVPKTNFLELNVIHMITNLGDHTGKVKAHISMGILNTGNLNDLEADLIFSTANLKEVNKISIDSKSSTFNIKQAATLKGRSEFSKFILGKIGQLELSYSGNDQFSIKEVKDFKVPESTFSNYNITTLLNSLEINAKSGDVLVGTIKEGFDHISLTNTFSTINLGVEHTKNYIIKAHDNIFTSYDYPDGLLTQKGDKKTRSVFLMGDQSKAGIIKIKCESCKVFFDY